MSKHNGHPTSNMIISGVLFLTLSILSIALGVFYLKQPKDDRSQAINPGSAFNAYNTHPNYWPAGSDKWTAKKYSLVRQSKDPGYQTYWVWSGPIDPNKANDLRYLHYQAYPNGQPGNTIEWEKWIGQRDNYAKVFNYGGPTEAQTKQVYAHKTLCQSQSSPGINWPNLPANKDYAVVGQSLRYPSGHCTEAYAPDKPNGDYIAIKMLENWDDPNSATRINKCNAYIWPENALTRKMCYRSAKVGILQQRYVISKDAGQPGDQYGHGCEMTIYAWGNPYSSDTNYQNWFRNGELRFTNYHNLGQLASPKAPNDDAWWTSTCTGNPQNNAWDKVPNWYYSGTYKLTSTEKVDNGN